MKFVVCDTEVPVSRETEDDLMRYVELLKKWTRRINLIAPSTETEIWERHIQNSALGYSAIRDLSGTWLDLGSGAGLPVIILTLLRQNAGNPITPICVESDGRKCEFLRTAARHLDINLRVFSEGIENFVPQEADFITSRALAPLPTLLGYCSRHLRQGGTAVLYKGKNWKNEVEDAKATWKFSYEVAGYDSRQESIVMKIGDISRV